MNKRHKIGALAIVGNVFGQQTIYPGSHILDFLSKISIQACQKQFNCRMSDRKMSDEQKKVQQSNIPQLGALELVDSEEMNLKR